MPVMKQGSVKTLLTTYWPSFWRSRQNAISLDGWATGKQYDQHEDDPDHPHFGRPYSPKGDTSEEYQNLSQLSPSPWGGLVIKSVAQTAFVDGIKLPGQNGNMKAWKTWQQNRMDSMQAPLIRAAVGHGCSYGLVLPGVDAFTKANMARITPRSAKRMAAFYDDDADEWATLAIEATPYEEVDSAGNIKRGWNVTLYDDLAGHRLYCEGDGFDKDAWNYIDYFEHPMGVTPVARCVNSIDLDGRATGELEPIIPLLRRVDQDVFDRLIVQRFGAWAIRYIAGMAKPDTEQEQQALSLAMRVDDLLMSTDPNTKFGSIPGTSIGGFTEATDADLRMLAAITQTPPHHLLGLSSNLQAEALAAAESGLQRKSADLKMHVGEFAEQLMRMTAKINGDTAEAAAFDLQVRWRDTESRSFNQTAQALGMVATQLGVPLEMLWEKLPNWTDSDTVRAKNLVEDGTFEKLVKELMDGAAAEEPTGGAGGANDAQQ